LGKHGTGKIVRSSTGTREKEIPIIYQALQFTGRYEAGKAIEAAELTIC
jgi:hypothetical protein